MMNIKEMNRELTDDELKSVAGGDEEPNIKCPRCTSWGTMKITYKQKTTQYGEEIDVRVLDCTFCGFHREIPLY